jgi:hypothetical protein
MQFLKSTVVFVLAFATFAAAAPSEAAGLEENWGKPKPECKPLLQSCKVDSECCGDLCVAGVGYPN